MRAAVSSLLSAPAAQSTMSRLDYQQTLEHHKSLLVLLKPLGKQLKPKVISRLADRVNRAVSGLTLTDSSGREREVCVRFLRDYAPDQNDWGEFQAHRKLLGLLTVAAVSSQTELNEICRQHESLKVKYSATLYDSRCIVMGLNPDGTLHRPAASTLQSPDTLGSPISLSPAPSSLNSPNPDDMADVPLPGSVTLVRSSSESSADQSSSSASSPTSASTSAATSAATSTNHTAGADEEGSTCSESTSAADSTLTSPASATPPLSLELEVGQVSLTTPSNFKTRALYYRDEDYALQVPPSSPGGGGGGCVLDADVREFVSSLFWVLEHKRLERSREKLDRVSLLLAPFERKDFVGLDLESRTNKRRSVGRGTKHLADLTLQAGLAAEAAAHYSASIDVLKGANDWLWLGGAYEGLCAASVSLLFPNLGKSSGPLQRNSSLQEKSSPDKCKPQSGPAGPVASLAVSTLSLQQDAPRPVELQHCLAPDDICKRYREAITHYSKYLHAAVLETEACFKAARIATAQNKRLQASSFLQNVILINLTLTEEQKIERFLAIADLYHTLGFFRKASFYRRLAGTRHVSAQNPNPDWARCYQLLLQALPGVRLSLDPQDMMTGAQQGWPALQIQLLQELVAASRRMGSPQVAVRHLTFLLQAMWCHLSVTERRELSLQLQAAASQCEGAPVPLVLASGVVLPPANLTSIPHTSWFEPRPLASSLRPRKLQAARVETGPFLFTPPSFGSLDRRDKRATPAADRGKLDFLWVEGDVCEVSMSVANPLPFELKVSDMRLLTEGAVFESVPSSLSLPSSGVSALPPGGSMQNSPDPSLSLPSSSSSSSASSNSLHPSLPPAAAQIHQVSLAGIPRDCGELQITGYSTHVLGVKSSCRLKQLPHLGGFPKYTLQVVPALPQVQVSTSFPKTLLSSTLGDSNNVVTSGTTSIYAGEIQECVVTLSNCHSSLPVTLLKVSTVTKLDLTSQREVFGSWDEQPMEILLPLTAGDSTVFTIHLYGKADFLTGSTQAASAYHGDSISLSSYSGSNFSRASSMMSGRAGGGPSSLPPSLSQPPLSPTPSLQFPNKPVLGENKVLEGVYKIQYSGGPGLTAGYCRVANLLIRMEVMPSLQVTKWDVLPAETASEFYLVLDVLNQAGQEAELHYAPGKSILVEGGEFCRVPVPVPRCPLSKLTKLYEKLEGHEQLCSELERVCSEHVAENVALRWVLADGRHGTLTLDGIHCSESMLDIVRSSPLDWELQVDGSSVGMEEVSCRAGQPISLAVRVCNKLPRALRDLTLGLALYQDHQNGVRNYRLETRLAIAGASSVLFDELGEEGSAQHRCTVVFFTPGQYKADIQCTTDPIGSHNTSSINAWKLNPALQFCVSEA